MDNMETIHGQVMRGVMRMLKLAVERTLAGESVSFGEVIDAGFEGANDDARMFIAEFAKDGLDGYPISEAERILAGDRDGLWASTNKYLAGFGYPPVEPFPIEV